MICYFFFFFFSSRRRHTRSLCDWSSDVCSSDLRYRPGHGRTFSPAALPDVVNQLTGGKAPIGLLADLTDEQLDSVPPAGSSRFSDGSRTLEQVIDEVIAHQAAHLVTLKRAVA